MFVTAGSLPEGKDVPSIHELAINEASVVGTIPADYAQLLYLNNLGLSDNSVSGTIMITVPQTLKLFDTSINALSGTMFPTFPAGSKLNYVSIRDNAISKFTLPGLATC